MKKAPPVRLRMLFMGAIAALIMGTVGYPNAPSIANVSAVTGPANLEQSREDNKVRLIIATAPTQIPEALAIVTSTESDACVPMNTMAMNGADQLAVSGQWASITDLQEVGRTHIVVTSASSLSLIRKTSASAFGSEKVGGPEIV